MNDNAPDASILMDDWFRKGLSVLEQEILHLDTQVDVDPMLVKIRRLSLGVHRAVLGAAYEWSKANPDVAIDKFMGGITAGMAEQLAFLAMSLQLNFTPVGPMELIYWNYLMRMDPALAVIQREVENGLAKEYQRIVDELQGAPGAKN